jgi:hypothetical protein
MKQKEGGTYSWLHNCSTRKLTIPRIITSRLSGCGEQTRRRDNPALRAGPPLLG